MAHMNNVNRTEIELEHLKKLKGSGYDTSCSGCGSMYQVKPVEGCDICTSQSFTPTTEVIRRLELNLQ
ncbi:MAG: hypothetical protein KKF67_02830 [Nanoarchaeota archaeon]|nr:hypothetical protein [Nanoarchaeota archaeon]